MASADLGRLLLAGAFHRLLKETADAAAEKPPTLIRGNFVP